jgi:hypothetical protein
LYRRNLLLIIRSAKLAVQRITNPAEPSLKDLVADMFDDAQAKRQHQEGAKPEGSPSKACVSGSVSELPIVSK